MSNNRIPSDKSSMFQSWDIPEVKKGQIVQAEKLNRRGPKGELVELSREEVVYSSITAAQLEEISLAAYEDVREQAYQDGLKQGQKEGYQAGLKQGQQTIAKLAGDLSQTLAALTTFLANQDDEVEQALVNLSISIASAILRRELSIDSSQVLAVVEEAVRTLPLTASNITVHLSEQDYQLLHEHEQIPAEWLLQIDRTLTPGGCRVVTSQSVVEYTLEDQFQQLVNSIVEKRYGQLQRAESETGSDDGG